MLPIYHCGIPKLQQRSSASVADALHGRLPSRVAVLFLALVVAAQPGCASIPQPQPPKTEYQADIGRVAVVAALRAPEIKLEGFAQDKGEGAAQGAGATAGGCLNIVSGGGGPFFLLGLVVCAVATPVGAVAGAIAAPSAKDVKATKATLSAALEVKVIQETLRDQVIAGALANNTLLVSIPSSAAGSAQPADYRPLARDGVDTVLEVAMKEIGTEGSGINPPLILHMTAHVRLIRTRDNTDLFSADYVYYGGQRKLSEWAANQNEQLLKALNAGFGVLGSHIYDSVFLLYPFPGREEESFEGHMDFGIPQHAFGLAPIYPGMSGSSAEEPPFFILHQTSYRKTDSLQPTFRWQPFPRKQDIEKAPKDMARVKDVRYDLVIAREHDEAPAEIIYRRDRLPSNAHTIETALKPKTRYFWSVRARFLLDGRERVTEWAADTFMERGIVTAPEIETAPSIRSYRFSTP